ncbi:MAG TPA: VOC family protein [Ktedonobacteraceae bacterium]|nr:VOC family protein [Ktedonobacteraceae bacterium]
MLIALDHIIIGVNNLEQATEVFAENLGLLASGKGIHPTGGTANRIIVIGNTYLELITVREPAEAQQSMLDRLAKGDGYLNFVLTSNDIETDSAAMRRRGVAIIGPNPGQLNASAGRFRAWSRTDIQQPDLAQHYPFLIQHDSTGAERRFRLAGWTQPPTHPLGASKVLSTTIAVNNLAEATPRFQGIYGLQPSEAFTGDVDDWEAMLTAFLIPASQQSFELAEPLPLATDTDDTRLDTELLPEAGALARYLQTFGESLCRITLGVEDMAQSRRYLDAHGVVYSYKEVARPTLWIHPSSACGAAIVLHEITE